MSKNKDIPKYFTFNMEKFMDGKCNYILITGFSGSGKSVLADRFSNKYDMIHIQLDLIDPRSVKELDEIGFDSTTEVIFDFLEDNPKMYDIIHSYKNAKQDDIDELFNKFIPYCLKWCKKHKEFKFIIDGIQIYQYSELIDKSLPIIIMNVSVDESMKRLSLKLGKKKGNEILKKSNLDKFIEFKNEVVSNQLNSSKYNPKYEFNEIKKV